MSLHVHFKWGVALVGKFLYWALFTPSWVNIFQVLEVYRKSKQVQGHNCEKGRVVVSSTFCNILDQMSNFML